MVMTVCAKGSREQKHLVNGEHHSGRGGTSLVVQWPRLCAPMQGVQVQPLVRELRSLMPHGTAKNSSSKQERSGHARATAALPRSTA